MNPSALQTEDIRAVGNPRAKAKHLHAYSATFQGSFIIRNLLGALRKRLSWVVMQTDVSSQIQNVPSGNWECTVCQRRVAWLLEVAVLLTSVAEMKILRYSLSSGALTDFIDHIAS